MTQSYNIGPENEEVFSDTEIVHMGAAVYDASANVKFIPVVMADGRVGYAVKGTDMNARCEFIYFNPSEETDGSPDLFVYQGESNDPVNDMSHCFFRVAEGWDE